MPTEPRLQPGDKIIVPDAYDQWARENTLVRINGQYTPVHAGQIGEVHTYFPAWQDRGDEDARYLVLTEHWSLMIPKAMAESAVKVTEGDAI